MVDVLDTDVRQGMSDMSAETPEPALVERRATTRKKLTIEVSADLHRRILMICATRHVPVNQAVREVLERGFPG